MLDYDNGKTKLLTMTLGILCRQSGSHVVSPCLQGQSKG